MFMDWSLWIGYQDGLAYFLFYTEVLQPFRSILIGLAGRQLIAAKHYQLPPSYYICTFGWILVKINELIDWLIDWSINSLTNFIWKIMYYAWANIRCHKSHGSTSGWRIPFTWFQGYHDVYDEDVSILVTRSTWTLIWPIWLRMVMTGVCGNRHDNVIQLAVVTATCIIFGVVCHSVVIVFCLALSQKTNSTSF